MTVQEFFSFLSRTALLLLTAIAILDYLRYQGTIRRDIALMLFSIAASIMASELNQLLPAPNVVVSRLGSLFLISQAYQMLRLVDYFQVVPRSWRVAAIGSMLISASFLLLYGNEIPHLGILFIVAYFVIFNGYAAVVFIQGARSKKGVSQKRLEFIALGSAFFALTLLLVGLAVIFPTFSTSLGSLVFVSLLISIITFYLGFNPFRWLRQSWQLQELRKFFTTFSSVRDKQTVYSLICEVATKLTAAEKADIIIWDSERQLWQLFTSQLQLENSSWVNCSLAPFWQADKVAQIQVTSLDPKEKEFLGIRTSNLLYLLPFLTQNKEKMKLLVYLEQGSLFPEDDLSLLQVLLEQASLNLNNLDLFTQLETQAASLEVLVQQRTQALTRQNQSLNLLQEVIIAANEVSSTEESLAKSLQIIAEALAVSIARVYSPPEIAPILMTQTSIWYLRNEMQYEQFRTALEASSFRSQLAVLADVLLAGQVICLNQLPQKSEFVEADLAAKLNIETGIFVPITIKNKFVAVLEFFSEQDLEVDRHLQDLLKNIASQLGRIIERKQSEEAMYRLNQELEQRVEERTAHLQALNQELEAFSYSVSHDLRAPLRAIDGFSQILLEDCYPQLDEEAQEYLNLVRAESQRMGQLIDDLIKLSRFTRDVLVPTELDLSAIAEEISLELQRSDPKRRVNFQIEANLTVCADAALIRVVLNNLLGNAWKYSRPTPEALIELNMGFANGERFYFVRDNGVGFDMAYVHKLFGAFQRLHGMNEFEGTGIGLATVQRIIHRHGGSVWAEGKLKEGACFYFTLGESSCK